jgi:hypothetical protein
MGYKASLNALGHVPYLSHLERVAGLARACGGDRAVQMAAYLLGVQGAGVLWCDLLRMGVPLPVYRLVEAARPVRFEPLDERWTRLRRNRWAAPHP